jgi:hypothetical protein
MEHAKDDQILRSLIEELLKNKIFNHSYFKTKVGLVSGQTGKITVQLTVS